MEHLFEIISIATLAVSFYFLADILKNTKVRLDRPEMGTVITKIVVSIIMLSHLGLLLLPDYSRELWLSFNTSVLMGLFSLAYSYHNKYAKIPIQMVEGRSFLSIPNDRYIEIEKGVTVRTFVSGGKKLHHEEQERIDWVTENGYLGDKWVIIFFSVKKGCSFPEHKHPKREHTWLLNGKAAVMKNRGAYKAHELIEVPPNTEHFFEAQEDCCGVSCVEL